MLTLLLTLSACAATAQHCDNSLLFKPGVVLTFKTYQTYMTSPKVKYHETTRLIVKVEAVKDSNSKRYSYITKTGVNPQNESLRYEKKYIIACDGQSFTIPIDLYFAEQVYFSNHYENNSPAALSDTGLYASYTFNNTVALRFPVSSSSLPVQLKGDRLDGQLYRRYYEETQKAGEVGGEITDRKITSTAAASFVYSDLRLGNRLSYEVPAGSFNCQLMSLAQTIELGKASFKQEQKVYYNHRLGIVRSEHYVNTTLYTMFTELVSVQE